MARAKGSVRIGPISIFALIILLSLTVLAVLALSTAQATYASAAKQMSYNTDVYVNETKAQELLATVDGELSQSRSRGESGMTALETLEEALPANAWIEDQKIQARYAADNGRTLDIELTIYDDATYSISRWQASTDWNYNNDLNLWNPSTDED